MSVVLNKEGGQESLFDKMATSVNSRAYPLWNTKVKANYPLHVQTSSAGSASWFRSSRGTSKRLRVEATRGISSFSQALNDIATYKKAYEKIKSKSANPLPSLSPGKIGGGLGEGRGV